jgi:hypothetical protein
VQEHVSADLGGRLLSLALRGRRSWEVVFKEGSQDLRIAASVSAQEVVDDLIAVMGRATNSTSGIETYCSMPHAMIACWRCLGGRQMKIIIGLLSAAVALWPVGEAAAQDAYKWSDVDCAKSRIVMLPGTKCRTTNVVSGGDTAAGQFQQWSLEGTGSYVNVRLHEALAGGSYIYTKQTGTEYLKSRDSRAKGSPDMGNAARHGDADYYLFKASSGENCAGFRRYGPSRSVGYLWIMSGVTCAPKGSALTPAQATAFIDSARVK